MCTFNGERFLPEQLDTIAAQTLPPAELVVCDDGSTDRTLEIIEDFARRAPFPVHLWRNPTRLGVAANFAHCIGLCTGHLIALADQDDRWLPNKLERLAPCFKDPTVTCVFSNGILIDEHSRDLGQQSWSRFLFTPALQQQMRRGDTAGVLLKLPVVSGAAMIFRTPLVRGSLPMPEGWVHDTWWAWMSGLRGRLVPIDEPLIQYRIHGTQQLGLAAQPGRVRLKRFGLPAWLAREREEAIRQYDHMARTFASLADFADARQIGTPEMRRAIRHKARFAQRARRLLNSPRLLRALPSLLLARDYHRFTPRGLQTILRHALL